MAEWYVSKSGRVSGPFSLEDLVAFVQQKQVADDDQVWTEGWPEWKSVRSTLLAQHLSQPQMMKPHRGGLIVALGVLGFCCIPLGIAAWAMGAHDLAEMRAGRMDSAGERMTRAGVVCGIIMTILQALYFVFLLAVLWRDI